MQDKAVKYMQNDLSSVAVAYERLVNKEDELIGKARTCEMIIDLVIKDLLANGQEYHFLTMEALLNAMQTVQEETLVELSLTRIQKDLHACLMKHTRRTREQNPSSS